MTSIPFQRRFPPVLSILISFSPLLFLLVLVAPGTPVQASSTEIHNCSNDSELAAAVLGGPGLITFNCGHTHAPAVIALNTALAPADGITIDGANGGHTIVLNGQGNTRVFQIGSGRQVTLTHLALTDGAAINGSCVDVLGTAELDSVEIHHCVAGPGNFGGGIYIETNASATLNDANLHDNSAGVSGGGLYNSDPSSTLYVTNSTIAHNTAGTDQGAVGDGGGLWNAGLALVSSSTFFSNTSTVGYGGGLYNQGHLEVTGGSIAQNFAPDYAGGVRNYAGSTHLTGVTVSGNQSSLGGGVASDGTGSELDIADSLFLDNQAAFDGGALYHGGLTLHIKTSLFRGNVATTAGGALDLNSLNPAYVYSSTFDGNAAQLGGAIFISLSGQADIEQATISGNNAVAGAGLINDGLATLTNDTLSGNTAGTHGGGLLGGSTSRTLLWNDTLAGNGAGTSGGSLYLGKTVVVTATNTIFAASPSGGNCAGENNRQIAASQSSLSDDTTCSLSGPVHGHDPNGQVLHLSGLGNYGGPTRVYMPEHDSPAIDGVSGANAPTIDQRGQPRPVNGGFGTDYDIGAVERQPGDSDLAPWLYLPLARR